MAVARFVLALVAACVASIVAALVVMQLAPTLPFWLAESVASAVAAMAWILVVAHIAPGHVIGSAVSFLLGTAAAWFFNRGLVHSTSPYYGLAPVLTAIIAAASTWWLICQSRRERTIVLAVALSTLLLATGVALGTPAFGVTRQLSDARDESRSVHVQFVRDTAYLWTAATLDPTAPVHVELDPGSGAGRFRLLPVPAGAKNRLICDEFHARIDSLVSDEVAGGHIPHFMTIVPFRFASCDDGQIWELRAWN